MIFGIGTDVVRIERIAAAYERFGGAFRRSAAAARKSAPYSMRTSGPRVFSPCASPPRKRSSRHWAPGSVTACGFATSDLSPNAWGRPEVRFSARGREVADQLGAGEGHVTLTDEAGLVVAVAILMKKP